MGKKEKLKQDKQRLERLRRESISITNFLSRVIGIRDNQILSSSISHEDIKTLLPEVKRDSFDHIIDNPGLIYSGEVLLVEDSYGHIVPYINPLTLEIAESTEYYGEFNDEPVVVDIPNINDFNLEELSIFELKQLLDTYSRYGLRSAYRKVHRELISRKDSKHANRKSIARTLRKQRKNERLDF